MKELLNTSIDFNNPFNISNVIRDTPSGIYSQKNIDDTIFDRYIRIQQGEGLICCTVYKNKPKYIECVCYDHNGFQTEVYYEPAV